MFDFSEKDSCGVGFIASRNIPPTHGMTLKVLECLANLDHRGAKFADGTGDGAGVLTEIPFELIRAELKELSIDLDEKTKIGIISCFFDPKNVDESIDLINEELEQKIEKNEPAFSNVETQKKKIDEELEQRKKELEVLKKRLSGMKNSDMKNDVEGDSKSVVEAASQIVATTNKRLQDTMKELDVIRQLLDKERKAHTETKKKLQN